MLKARKKTQIQLLLQLMTSWLALLINGFWVTALLAKFVNWKTKLNAPENVHSLKPLKVNAELYYTIHRDSIEADRNPQYVSTAIAKSAQPYTSAWASIFAADAAYMDANPGQKECSIQVTPECAHQPFPDP